MLIAILLPLDLGHALKADIVVYHQRYQEQKGSGWKHARTS